ncbi:MAG TPA: diguanylate cyclase [Lacipirellulaceae bacterium]|nr:diguanylate cyclase [Lacipirellulaceae bacterium]
MLLLPAAIGTFLLVNLLCACVALGVGFAAGVWFFGAKMAKPAGNEPDKKRSAKQADEAKRAAERASMAASRVADLAQNVASDVGDHAAKMKAISADLAGIDRSSDTANAAVFSAMDQMLAANTELQQRLEQAEKQLAAQAAEIKTHESEARTDSLTGLANRRAFDDELKRRFSEWQRKNTPCTLVMLDIDFFKKFNDTHGHQVGDEVLRQVAKVLAAQSRDMDMPCRYGGEEFGVILPATDAAAACKVAERIRAAVEASTTNSSGKTLKVTCSLGVADFTGTDDIAALIRRADDALYASKKAGRNCGHWNTGTKHVPITAPEEALVAAVAPPEVAKAVEAAPADEHTKSAEAPGAPSGATFIQMLKRRVTESHRFGIPISVMYVKLDEYDIINRKYGSPIARQMVDAAGPAFQRVLREMDVMAKLENGEFVVMLPGSTYSEVNQVVKRMRVATGNCVLPLLDRELKVEFQHGVAELKTGETAQELLARARQAVSIEPRAQAAATFDR